MTETTEEKHEEVQAILSSLEDESAAFKRMTGIAHWLIKHSHELEAQVSSITEERDELKTINENLKRDFKFKCGQLAEHMQARLMLANENKKLQSQLSNRDKEREELKKDKNSILQLFNDPDYFYDPNDTDSNECIRIEDFNEKLKDYDEGEVLKLIPVHELLPRYFVVGDHDQYFKTEHEALASLNKEGEEE